MPRANRDTVTTIPAREYFEHAHEDDSSEFPPTLASTETGTMLWKCPTDWGGFNLMRLWFLGIQNQNAVPLTIDVIAGTCDELYYAHNQEDDTKTIDLVADTYTCLDITENFETVLALITSCDLVQITVTNNSEDSQDFILIGVEIVEA